MEYNQTEMLKFHEIEFGLYDVKHLYIELKQVPFTSNVSL